MSCASSMLPRPFVFALDHCLIDDAADDSVWLQLFADVEQVQKVVVAEDDDWLCDLEPVGATGRARTNRP